MGFLYYCILSGGRGFFLKVESSAIEKVMGEIQDRSAYEMCFWPRSGIREVNGAEYEAYNCFVIRGAKQAYYYSMRYRYSNPLSFDPNDLDRYVPRLNSLSFALIATCDANTRLHLWGLEDGNPIFLGTEAVSDKFAVTPQQQAALTAMAEATEDPAALDDAYKRRLCIARLDEAGKELSFSGWSTAASPPCRRAPRGTASRSAAGSSAAPPTTSPRR